MGVYILNLFSVLKEPLKLGVSVKIRKPDYLIFWSGIRFKKSENSDILSKSRTGYQILIFLINSD